MSLLNFITPKEIPVKRFAGDYSPDELAQIKESFKPIAEKNRKRQGVTDIIVMVLIFALLISVAIPKTFPNLSISPEAGLWICVSLAGCVFLLVMLMITDRTPPLKCPACNNHLVNVKKFCPECGSQLIMVRRFLQDVLRCEGCNKDILIRKGKRYFKIKYCTCCAVEIDEKGL